MTNCYLSAERIGGAINLYVAGDISENVDTNKSPIHFPIQKGLQPKCREELLFDLLLLALLQMFHTSVSLKTKHD